MDRLAVSLSLAALLVVTAAARAQAPAPSTRPVEKSAADKSRADAKPPEAARGSKPDAAKPDAAKPDAPKPDAPKPQAPKAEPPKAEPPRAEPPRAEPPRAEPPKADTAKAEPKPEAPKGASKREGAPKPEAAKLEAKAEPPRPSKKHDAAPSAKTGSEGARNSAVSPPGSLPELERAGSEIDPRRGRGARNVGEEAPLPSASEVQPGKAPKAAVPATLPGQRGKLGRSPTRTKGMTKPEPDATQRRIIAQGPTSDDLRAGKDDAELRSLRDAELVLFPRPLPGFVPGWSWELPRPSEPSLPEIVAGAPPASRPLAPPKAAAPDAEWLKTLTQPNLPTRLEQRVIRYLTFYRDSPSGRSIARVWAKKSGRYTAALRGELAKAGLPTDLVWLSLIESGHNPTIVSPAGAVGLWQFMPDAGRAYGLVIDRWVDERLDPERSTEAACRYLSDLYRRFGSWELAMAAYNMGHGGLSRAIRKYNTNDFWELSEYEAGLPWETTLYVPKILATAIVMLNRRSYGIDGIEPEPAERFENVLVAGGVPLEDLARLAGVPVAELEAMNPQYLAGRTPPAPARAEARSWPVRVRAGRGAALQQALAREVPGDDSLVAHVVTRGETVESIALLRGTTEALVRSLNRLDAREALAPGTVLLVPRIERGREDDAGGNNVVVVPPRAFTYPDRKRVFYRVTGSDSLPRVAEAFGLAPSDVVLWNALDESARLHPGMVLQLFVPSGRELGKVRAIPEQKVRVLTAGSTEFFDYFEGQNGKKRFVVRAKNGDTLAQIGRRYGMSVGWMERANRRSRTDPVSAGEPVVVYTERPRPVPGDELYVDPRPRPGSGGAGPAAADAPDMAAVHDAEPASKVD